MSCEDDTVTAGTIAVLATKVPQRGFKDALAEVRRQGRPMTLDLAETIAGRLGGASGLGDLIVDDFHRLRGTHLDDDLKAFHDPDWKTLKGYTDILTRLMKDRDALVDNSVDPLDGVSEEDLMSIASVAALARLETDAEFRKQLLRAITPIDPEAVLDAACEAIALMESQPKVEVVDVD